MDSIDNYILRHIDPEHPYLHQLWRATHLHLNYPRMASGHLQGKVLRMLVQMIRPHTVLELGTYSGYSALCMASALQDDAVLHTVEIYDEQEDFTRPWLEGSPWASHIRFHIGDALTLLDTTLADLTFDLVFIDADKRHYLDYYRALLPRVRPGGYILADNTLWDGHVLEFKGSSQSAAAEPSAKVPANAKDSQTLGIMAFNDALAADTSVEKVILPLRDGLTIIRKK